MKRTIRVTGKGKISLQPDTVRLKIDLYDRDKDYNEVVRKSTEHSRTVKKAFAALGFAETDLKTLNFKVEAEYENHREEGTPNFLFGKKIFVGYKAAHSLKIEFDRKLECLGDVLSMVARLPSHPEFYIEYTVKDTEAAKNELLARAVADSKAKAQILAAAAGVQLGDIINIDYSWGEIDLFSKPFNRLADLEDEYYDDEEEAPDYNLDIEPDDIKAEDTVTVVWEISPAR